MTKYLGENKTIYVPNFYEGKKVVGINCKFESRGINNEVIMSEKDIEKVIISEGVEFFHENTFMNCSNLKYIQIPSTIKEIKTFYWSGICENPFSGCSRDLVINLNTNDSFSYENGILYDTILNRVVYVSPTLTGVIQLRDDTKVIGKKAFCNSLIEEVIFPQSLEEIYEYGFFNCLNMHAFILNENFKKLHRYALQNCPSVIDLHIPKNVVLELNALGYLRESK